MASPNPAVLKRLILLSLLLLGLLGAQPAWAATCTQDQKDARVAAASAYAQHLVAARKAYFRTHKSPAQRRAFVAKQTKSLAALRLAATCTVVAPPPPAPPPSKLILGPGLNSSQIDFMQRGYDIGLSYLPKIGAPASWRTDVFVEPTVAAMTQHESHAATYMPEGGGAYVFGGHTVYIVPAGHSYDSFSDARRVMVPLHEMFHTMQESLAPGFSRPQRSSILPGGPVWLIEGAAEYVSYSAVSEAGLDASGFRRDEVWETTQHYANVPLQATASREDQGFYSIAPYAEGFIAVERLVQMKGITSLAAYWGLVGKGTAWPAAFQQVFGLSVEQFYTDFAAYRQTL